MVGSDVFTICNCDGDTILCLLRGITHVNGYGSRKLLCADGVGLVKVGGVGHFRRLCRRPVDSNFKFT